MKIRKRFISLMLVITMIFMGIQVEGISSKAQEISYTETSITGSLNANTNNGHWRINLGTDVTLPGDSNDYYTGLTVETSLPGSVQEVYRAAGQTLMLILWGSGTTAKEGDYVTLKAGYGVHKTNTSLGIHIKKDYTVVYHENTHAWELKVDYTEMPVTGFTAPYYDNEGHWRMNLSTSAAFPADGMYTGAVIEVNGSTSSNAYVYNNAGNLLLVMPGWTDKTLADKTTITLKEGYAVSASDKNVGIHIPKQYTFVYDAGTETWTQTVYTEMNLENCLSSLINSNSHWRINLNTSAAFPSTSSSDAFFNGLAIEGTDVNITAAQVYKAGEQIMMLILWNSGTEVKDGALVTVKAGYALNQKDPTIGIHVTEDFTVVYDALTSTWSRYVHTDYSDITGTGLGSTSWYKDGSSRHWRLYAKVSGSFPSSDTASGFYTVPVYLNDQVTAETKGAQVYKSGSTIGLLLWGYHVEKPDVGTTITIKAGNYKDTGDATIGIRFTKDIKFTWDGSEWYYAVAPDETAEFALDTTYNNGGDAENIYLTSTDEREVPKDGAGGSKTDITAVKSEPYSGVLYNGAETTASIRKFLKADETNAGYRVVLGEAGIKAVKGDLVTVQGIFSYDNYAVEYEEIALLYDGVQWNTCYTVTPVRSGQSGVDFLTTDADGNAFFDSLPYNGDWSVNYYFAQGGLYHNGDLIVGNSNRLVKLTDRRYYAAGIPATVLNDLVTVDGIILSSENRTAVKFNRTTFKKTGDSAWTIIDETVYDKTISLTVDIEQSSVDEENVCLVLESTKGVLGEPEQAVWSGVSVLAADANGAITDLGKLSMKKDNRGMLAVTIPRSSLPSGNCMVTVKTGVLSPVITGFDEATKIDPMYIIKDSFIYINEYGVGRNGYIKRANSGINDEVLALDRTGTAGIIEWTMAANTLTEDVDLYPADADSGVFINGERQEDISVRKTSDTIITADLSGYDIKVDTHIMILGTFKCEEEFIEIAPVAASYDGSSWKSADTSYQAKVVLNILDDEYVAEGTDVTIKKNGETVEQKVLYTAGEYEIVRKIGNVTINYQVSLYRPNDINQNNCYDVQDLVKALKYADQQKTDMTDAGELAAKEGSVSETRSYILGITKADETLPTAMIGATGNTGTETYTTYTKYISSVTGTQNGTTVIGLSDSETDYQPAADYDAYGFDYVLDYQVAEDRELRILQLTDTQIIDSAQMRYNGRIGAASIEAWTPDQMEALVFECMRKTVQEAQPDLILLTGDNIFGEFDDNGTSLEALVKEMESYKIPWAPVYGNHDNECYKGVKWQNELFENATYCLYYSGHDIGGNSNYSIGIAKNGELQRSVFMMDSNFCANMSVYEDGVRTDKQHVNQDGDLSNGEIITQRGFVDSQTDWYRTTALRINEVAGKTIPSMLYYHVPTVEVWLAAKAACYQQGLQDKSSIKYALGEDIKIVQQGDNGFKYGAMITEAGSMSGATELLDIMNEVGGDSAAFGHEHLCGISLTYGGVRWTFGLKTGNYDSSPTNQGGTLFTISSNGASFAVTQVVTQIVQ